MNTHSTDNAEPTATPKNKADAQDNTFSKVLRVLAFPISFISGLIVAHVQVRGSAAREAINDGSLKDIVDNYSKQRSPIITARIRGELSAEEFSKLSIEARDIYRHAADARMQHMGHGSFLERLSYVPRSAAQKALLEGVAVAGVTLGALLALSNSRLLSVFKNDREDNGPAKE